MKKKVQKSILFLLTVMMLVSVMSMGICGISAMAASVTTVDDVLISVPETVYMTPSTGASTKGQYYVNNTIDANGNVSLQSTNGDTTGYIAIYAPGMTAFEFNVAIAGQADSSATFSFENTSFTTEYMASANCGDTKGYIFYDGVNLEGLTSGLSAGSTALAEWTFKISYADGSVNTYYAYSTLYAPYLVPVGSAVRVNAKATNNTYAQTISWISGVHSINASSDGRQPNFILSSQGRGMLGFLGANNSAYVGSTAVSGVKGSVGDMYAVFASTDASNSYFRAGQSGSSLDNAGCVDWFNGSSTLGINSFDYYDTEGNPSSNYRSGLLYSKASGNITIDTSRYSNLNQIPNLGVGLLVTDNENGSIASWYVADFSDTYTYGKVTDYFQKNESDSTKFFADRGTLLGSQLANATDYNSSLSSSYAGAGLKYAGSWNRALKSGGSATYAVKTFFGSRNSKSTHALAYSFTDLNATQIDKSTLRNLVMQGTSLNKANYTTDSWNAYQTALRNAALALGNPGNASVDTTALTNARNALQTTVKLNANGGSIGTTSFNQTVGAAATYSYNVASYTPSRTGYTFKGWATSASATSGATTVSAGLMPTLYAVWEANKYTVMLDNLLDFSKWNTSSANNAVISNVGDGGFTITSNDGVSEGTSTSPLFPVTAGKNYVVDIDIEGTNWDVYIFFYDNSMSSGTGLEFVDSALRRFSSSGVGNFDENGNAVFTAPSGATRAVIRVDANGSNNAVTYKNIKVYEQGTVEDGVSFTPSQTVTYDSTYGTLPTPTRTGYDFVGWFDANGNQVKSTDTVKVTDTLYLTSKWKIQEYTVTWKNYDGTVLETDTKVAYGATPEYNGATPSKTGNAQYTYTFTGWSPSLSPVTGDVTYTAQFSQSVNKYKVEWKNYDGVILETDNDIAYGTTPEYNGATPTRPATKQYTYTFAGWTPTVDKVTGNVVYTAKFTETVNTYKVVWQNYDGNVLETDDSVPYGTVPTYNGATPVKPETEQYTYTFITWTPAVEAITGNITYTATFEQKTKAFTVVWQNYDGTVLETDNNVAYGTTPSFDKSTPVKPGNAQYSYTFTGWSPAVSAVTGNATYVAQFEESVNTYVITWTFADGSKQTVELSYGAAITAPANSTKDPDAVYHYSYAWDPAVAATVTGTAAYTEKLTATSHDWEWEEVTAPSCTAEGSKKRECSVCGFTETATIDKLPHTPGTAVEENRTESTCKVAGSYEEVVYCTECDEELSRKTVTLPLAEHTPGETVIENDVPAKCTVDGSYDEVVYCTVCDEELSRTGKVHTAPGHTAGEAVIENDIKPDCENGGSYDTVVYCSVCDAELSRVTTTVDKLGHTEGEVVIENDVPASCTVNGSYDEVVYCTVCDKEVSRVTKVHTAPGHTPKAPVEENRTESTCTVKGSYDSVVYCSVCGTKISSSKVYLDLAPHTPGTAVTENKVDAECTVDGSYDEVVYCTECPAEISRVKKTITAPGHTPKAPVEENRTESTCTVAGSYENVVYCSVCDAEVSRVKVDLPLAEHTPGETVIENDVPASCTVNGSYDEVVYCSVCNEELSRVTKAHTAPGHSPKEAARENYVPATCKNDGSYDMVVRCDVCNEILSSEHFVEVATGDHVYATEVERLDPTCLDDGYVIMACGCGTEQETILYATGHTGDTPVIENDVPATCVVNGSYDEVVYCKDCGTELSRVEKVHTAPGHSPAAAVEENRIPATCITKGSYDEVVYCSVCNTELSRTERELDIIPHTPSAAVEENVVDSTCKVPGSYDEVVYCSVCNGELSRTEKEIPVIPHTPAEAVKENNVPASCMVNGSYQMVVYCSVCGDEISRTNHVNVAPGHTPADAVVENTIDATCTKKGSYDEVVYCSVCDEELSRVTKEISIVPHTPSEAVEENVVDPTCKVPGSYDEVVYCSVCNGELSRTEKTIPVVPHTPDTAVEENRTESTCKVQGSYDTVVYCSVCGDELSRVTTDLPLADHIEGEAVEENRTESTCKVQGSYDTVVYCTVCGEELSRATTDLPLADHTEGEIVVENDVPASCTVDGSYDEVVYCTVCGEELSRETKVHTAPGHTDGEAVVENDVPASCTVDGSYDEVVYCTVCGEEVSRETKVHTAPGHTAGLAVRENEVIGNCITGSTYDEVVYCTVCGEEMSREHKTVASGSHKPGEIVIENKVEGTCIVASSHDEVRYCTECGDETSRITIYGSTASHKCGKAVKENEIPATCTTPGTYDQVVYCTVCGTECSRTTVSVGAKGHTIVADAAVAPTCDKTGKTLGSHCSVCDVVIVAQQTVPASGHTEIIDRAVDSTCTRPGKTEGSHCGECGKVIVAQDEIPADGHLDENGDGICDIDGRDVNDMDPDYDSGIGFGPDYEGGDYEEDLCDRCGREHINFFSEIICLIIRFFRLLGMNV